ncbi:MAG: DinB family protein [Dehalococcoidia bacterium]
MDIRDLLIDGTTQLAEWTDEALAPLTLDQVNWLPAGKTVSLGFSAWHIMRTADNITNFVMRNRTPPIWISQGYVDKMGLPKVDQGTGMGLEDARAIKITDLALLREYGNVVYRDVNAFLKDWPLEQANEVQVIKPLGEMPRWRVFRQVVMTHGFMHLGEINLIKGIHGLQFSI